MRTADKGFFRQAHPRHLEDTRAQRGLAMHVADLIIAEIQRVKTEIGLEVIAVCTDAASNCRSARAMVHRNYPAIVVLDCAAHQVDT